ncbi:MAG: hypothetical protein ACP5JW_05225 [Candidatus Bathyarchaeia archaeon]
MRAESAIVIAASVCLFLTFYFSYLSLQVFDDALKKQFILLAMSSLLIGATIFGCFVVYLGIRKIFIKAKLSEIKEASASEN